MPLPITESQALTTRCPKCRAAAGARCTNADGTLRNRLHAERLSSKRALLALSRRFFT